MNLSLMNLAPMNLNWELSCGIGLVVLATASLWALFAALSRKYAGTGVMENKSKASRP